MTAFETPEYSPAWCMIGSWVGSTVLSMAYPIGFLLLLLALPVSSIVAEAVAARIRKRQTSAPYERWLPVLVGLIPAVLAPLLTAPWR